MTISDYISEYLEMEKKTIESLNREELLSVVNAFLDVYEKEGTIYVFGNGGSASTASHMANDYNKGLNEFLDKKFRFVCLNDNVATLMSIANDISYEEVFRMQLRGKLEEKDLVVGISGSGNIQMLKLLYHHRYKKYKRSNPSSKNEKYHTHIVSCGHYVHFDCYLKMQTETLVKKNTVLMECPLCKAMTNLCVHDIMSCKEQNLIENIVCGYSLENILDDNFKIENVMSQSALKVVPQCQDFIERILAVKDKHEVLIKDLSAEKEFVYWYKKLSEDFGEQVDFMNSYKDSTINMTILTNFVIAMRVLLITGAIPHIDKVRNSMKEIINKLKEQKNNIDYVNNDYKAMINELFFSLCILISPSAFNNSIKTIIDLINPLISYNSAIKSEFVKTGNTNITISQAIDQSIFSSCFNIIQSKLSLI